MKRIEERGAFFWLIHYRRRLIGARERPRNVPICHGVYAVQIVYRIKKVITHSWQ